MVWPVEDRTSLLSATDKRYPNSFAPFTYVVGIGRLMNVSSIALIIVHPMLDVSQESRMNCAQGLHVRLLQPTSTSKAQNSIGFG